jgi:ribose transport system substrate-binding protein
MRHSRTTAFRRLGVIAAVATAGLALAACTPTTPSTPTESAVADTPLSIAYISFAVQNTYDAPMLAAAEAVAEANNATVTVLDGNLDPATQSQLIQDAITSGKYDGIITQPVYGPAILTDVQDAIAAGIPVVNIDQILGDDLTTGATQVDGLIANVVFVPSDLGTKFGEQIVAACDEGGFSPCNVAWLHDVTGSAIDIAFTDAVNEVLTGTDVSIVATGDTYYTPSVAQTAAADILTAQGSGINVWASSDQGLQGIFAALDAAGTAYDTYQYVGYGASQWVLPFVADGTVFADIAQIPATEGKLGMQAMIDYLRNGTVSGDIDAFSSLPNGGVITKDTAGEFTGEWVG